MTTRRTERPQFPHAWGRTHRGDPAHSHIATPAHHTQDVPPRARRGDHTCRHALLLPAGGRGVPCAMPPPVGKLGAGVRSLGSVGAMSPQGDTPWTWQDSSTRSGTRSPSGWWSRTRPSTGRPSTPSFSPRSCAGRSARRPTPSVAPPSPSGPTRARPSSARWAPARRSSRRAPHMPPASGESWCSARRTSCGSGSARWRRPCPNARAAIVTSITDLERLRLLPRTSPLFAVMSRERAKLSYRWEPAVLERLGRGGRQARA